jgi:signal transduction histidine kinase
MVELQKAAENGFNLSDEPRCQPGDQSSERWMRQLVNQVIKAQEEERKRVSRELHDEAGQALTVLKISLEFILLELTERHVDPLLCRRMKDALELCESTMAGIRLMAHNLRPGGLDDLGLNLTLDGLCRDFAERTHLWIVYAGVELPILTDTVVICLYRFLQEGLTNVAKHACATNVRVHLYYENNNIRLAIEDDGKGFKYQPDLHLVTQSNGIGLLGLKERLSSVGGYLEIVSKVGEGTRLTAVVPYKEAG